MNQTLSLYRLQLIDRQMDLVQDHLRVIQQKLEDDAALRQLREQVQSVESGRTTIEKKLHQEEATVQDQKIKIEQAESSLYSGNVKNPKELQDLQNDASSLKKRLAQLEDQLLEAMLELEVAEKAFNQAFSELQSAQAKGAQQNQSLLQEQISLQKELQKLSTERLALASTLSEENIRLYDGLRQQLRGVAVATVSDNACDACGSQLTPALAQTARSGGQMARCPTCGRILFGG